VTGNKPEKQFLEALNTVILEGLSNNPAGNRPVIILSSRLSSLNGLLIEKKEEGIVPNRLFELKYSWVSCLAYIKLEGIDPVN
jgi:hypothetical protein